MAAGSSPRHAGDGWAQRRCGARPPRVHRGSMGNGDAEDPAANAAYLHWTGPREGF